MALAERVDWARVISRGFGDPNNGGNLESCSVQQHVICWHHQWIERCRGVVHINGTDWEQTNDDGFGIAATSAVVAFAVFSDHLYAGTGATQRERKYGGRTASHGHRR